MSEAHVFQNARGTTVSGGTFYTANTIHINNIDNGSRTISDGVMSLMPNPSNRFTGRTEAIAKLKSHFFTNTNDSGQNRKFFLLYGMGGIGKTQICLKFVEEMYDSFSQVFWVDASSSGTILQALKGISQSYALDGSPESALRWIGSLSENYLLIFDNADVLSPAELE
ncbi:hypothetical protein K443DRAFT_685293 [Laccaria amethystina LaAM-08-1]|uniref:NB-ARC domain-containing protein n=1 Tax=Laccaria amethystina LaAM-08-1 TaxID=1095629 RepID=A0A0C9WUY2_9AGAR|nr:hypothetical protein K443DRAFT_685293 [Laccaria amethystina LaAM-08-1]